MTYSQLTHGVATLRSAAALNGAIGFNLEHISSHVDSSATASRAKRPSSDQFVCFCVGVLVSKHIVFVFVSKRHGPRFPRREARISIALLSGRAARLELESNQSRMQ